MANTYRVYNKCNYNIGVKLATNNIEKNIEAGSFQVLTDDDILYIENACKVNKFFSKRMLVPYDNEGHEVPLESLLITKSPKVVEHLDENAIRAGLKQSKTRMEKWLDTIDDPAELHSIYLVAKDMNDLTKDKLQVLQAKIPNKDWSAES